MDIFGSCCGRVLGVGWVAPSPDGLTAQVVWVGQTKACWLPLYEGDDDEVSVDDADDLLVCS